MLRDVTRKLRQQLAWIASLVAVLAVLAWQLLGARDDGGRTSDEPQRVDSEHPTKRSRRTETSRRPDESRGSDPSRRTDPSQRPDDSRRTDEPRRTNDRRGPAESTKTDGLDLPPEARATVSAILRGGPFRYRQDGAVFQNREGHLPTQPRGYYREYTVETPGSRDRGPRRIVTGGDPPTEFFYTSDHYRSFRRIEVPR